MSCWFRSHYHCFTNQPEQANQTVYASTPEITSWQSDISDEEDFYLYNKVTGEVRKYAQKEHTVKKGYNHYVETKKVNSL